MYIVTVSTEIMAHSEVFGFSGVLLHINFTKYFIDKQTVQNFAEKMQIWKITFDEQKPNVRIKAKLADSA